MRTFHFNFLHSSHFNLVNFGDESEIHAVKCYQDSSKDFISPQSTPYFHSEYPFVTSVINFCKYEHIDLKASLNKVKKREIQIKNGEEYDRISHMLRSLSDKSHGAVMEVTVKNAGDIQKLTTWYFYIFNLLQNYCCNWISNSSSASNLFSIHNSSEIAALLYVNVKELTFFRKLFLDVAIDHDTKPIDKKVACIIPDSQQFLAAYLEDITRWLFTGRFRKYYFIWRKTGMEQLLKKRNRIEFPEKYFQFPNRSIIPPTPIQSFPDFYLASFKIDMKEEFDDDEEIDDKFNELHPITGKVPDNFSFGHNC